MTSGFAYDFGLSNEELLGRCKEKDEAALRELLRRHERPVYSMLYRMLGSHEDAEEALADVFVKVWRSAGSFRGASKFTTWLYRIAGNTAKDKLRSRRARPEVAVEDEIITEVLVSHSAADPEQAAVQADEVARIELAMQNLSYEDRLLVSLYHIEERSMEEIAEITGHSRGNLKVKLFRARQRLRKLLGEMDQETSDEMQSGTTESIGLQPGTSE
ncbi:MAG: RNA polymerase sigma factor [Armatimonadetes bacterium]|nr:RNA polymerase sigma factor [Armatimonadota bacterium]